MSSFAGTLKVKSPPQCLYKHMHTLLTCWATVLWTDSWNLFITTLKVFIFFWLKISLAMTLTESAGLLYLQHILSWRIRFIAPTPTRPVSPRVWVTYLENCVSRTFEIYASSPVMYGQEHPPTYLMDLRMMASTHTDAQTPLQRHCHTLIYIS